MINFRERLLGNAQQGLEQILDVQNLEQIRRKDQVILPQIIFDKARYDLELTLVDGRERLTHFDVVKGQLQPTREETGLPLDAVNGELKGSVRMSWLRAFYEFFLARPIPVHLHTHPILTESYLKDHNINTVYKGLSSEQSIALVNESSNFLSPKDLGHMEAKDSFIRSTLLTANGGYTWVINPNPDTRVDFTCPASTQYERDFKGIFSLMASTMHREGNTSIDSDRVNRFLLQKLYDFCYEKGFVGFYNRDKNNSELTTLRYLPY